jgi:hypothetical protein
MVKKTLLLLAATALTALVVHGLFVQPGSRGTEYVWLVFGPTAKVRVLVTVTGDTIALQHFAGEKPAGREEQFRNRGQPLDITLADPDGVTSYVIRSVGTVPRDAVTEQLQAKVDVNRPVPYRQWGGTSSAARGLETAPVLHFHGPLTIRPVAVDGTTPAELTLCRGRTGTDLRACIGTQNATRRGWVVVCTHEGKDRCLFADGVRPFADIEFLPRTPGDPPIKRRYTLDHFC